MRTLLIALSFLTASISHGKESIPEYYISKDVTDATLKKTEALFVFNFFDSNGQRIKKEIKMSFNKTDKTINPDNKGNFTLNIKPGKYLFQFYYNRSHFEITTDSILIKPQHKVELQVNFKSADRPVMAEKPVIYLYPAKTTSVNVTLNLKGQLGFTYPQYNNGWQFEADPDGTIHQGKTKYHYLFWDGEIKIQPEKLNFSQGFVVGKNELIPFFEKQLSAMGLNSKETEDFITYWCPKMSANNFNFVHFMFNEEYDNYARLNIQPKPTSVFRLFMIWNACDENKKQKISPQQNKSFKRNGFTVVEWGGAEVDKMQEEKGMNP